MINLKDIRRLKSKPLSFGSHKPQIDPQTSVLKGVVMAQVGEAKGHGIHLEQGFIDALIAYDNQHFSEIGIKARFDHPALCDGTMGTQLGKFTNFRVEGDKAVADLQLLDAANISPVRPNAKDWVLKMAEESPDFLMSSIVFNSAGYYQRDANGDKLVLYTRNAQGQMEWKNDYNPDYGNIYVEMGDHYYTDIVEAGAATDNLFSEQFNQDKFGVQATSFFEEHTELHDFLKANPSVVAEFLGKIGVLTNPSVVFDNSAQLAVLETEMTALKADKVTFETQIANQTARIAELEAENLELKSHPAATHTGGESGNTIVETLTKTPTADRFNAAINASLKK
jgi:hypothetical protein